MGCLASEVGAEPVAGGVNGGIEGLVVADEVATGDQDELLWVSGSLVGVELQIGEGNLVMGGDHQEQRGGGYPSDVASGFVLPRSGQRLQGDGVDERRWLAGRPVHELVRFGPGVHRRHTGPVLDQRA